MWKNGRMRSKTYFIQFIFNEVQNDQSFPNKWIANPFKVDNQYESDGLSDKDQIFSSFISLPAQSWITYLRIVPNL